jgi:hypothetical protein
VVVGPAAIEAGVVTSHNLLNVTPSGLRDGCERLGLPGTRPTPCERAFLVCVDGALPRPPGRGSDGPLAVMTRRPCAEK